jgi:sugar phosphate isomerase/epimerase
MKLGVSNLAWEDNIDLNYLVDLFKDNNINYIEAVLSKYIDWENINLDKLNRFISHIKSNELNIISTQSIFFNSNVKSFHDVNFKHHLQKVSDVCFNFHIQFIVLGAPTLRNFKIDLGLTDYFSYVNEILRNNNQILLIEPNSKTYNGNFFYTLREINEFITQNNFTNIKTMIDTHNILLEKEKPFENFLTYSDLIYHVHISENNLGDFIESQDHNILAHTLKNQNYQGLVIYEAKPSLNLKSSIESFNKTYNI